MLQELEKLDVRLTYFPPGADKPVEHAIERFPCIVGRNEECDLTINSGRVSREHATITYDGAAFRVRDLGSTNGTCVNGRPIDEAILRDGDIVVFADIEFTFTTGAEAGPVSKATQVIEQALEAPAERPPVVAPAVPSGPQPAFPATWWIDRLRRAHETLAQRAVRTQIGPIVALADGATVGLEPSVGGDPRDAIEPSLSMDAESRLAAAHRHLQRMTALEDALEENSEAFVLLRLDAAEIGAPQLRGSLTALAAIVERRDRIVVGIPDEAISETEYVAELHQWLHKRGFRIMHEGFTGPAGELRTRETIRPDFVKLPPPTTRGVASNEQRREYLTSLVEAAHALQAEVVASTIIDQADIDAAREIGVLYASGLASASSANVIDAVHESEAQDAASSEIAEPSLEPQSEPVEHDTGAGPPQV